MVTVLPEAPTLAVPIRPVWSPNSATLLASTREASIGLLKVTARAERAVSASTALAEGVVPATRSGATFG